MWKQRAQELRKWLQTTPPASHGAKDFLRIRFGVRPAVPFVPGHAFDLQMDETFAAPIGGPEPLTLAGARD